MKLPITDQFLWDVYSFLEIFGDIVDFVLSNKYKQIRILTGGENPIFRKYEKELGKRKFGKLIYYLKKNNLIKVKDLKGKQAVILTKGGISKVLRASFKVEKKEKRKDGKWIMLTFDIPEKHRKSRLLLRSILLNLEYKMFQQSIWVCPYDVSEKTEKLLQMYDLDKYVKIFLIEEI